MKGTVLKFGEIDSHKSVFQKDSFDNDFPIDVQLNLEHSDDKRDVIGTAKIDRTEAGLEYEATFFDDERSQYARKQIVDFPDSLQVSVESNATDVEMNADGVSFYRNASITGLAVVMYGSAPSASVETKRNKEENELTLEKNAEIQKLELEIKREELAQAKAKTVSLESANKLEAEKKAELERSALEKQPKGANWLDSEEATLEFGRALLDGTEFNPFKEAWFSIIKKNDESSKIERQAKNFSKKWKKTLVTRGIAGFQAPSGFLEAINDAVTHNAQFWDLLNHTGLQTMQISPALTPEGKGWANNQDTPTNAKTESKITLAPRQLTPQDVYIYTTVARSTILLNKDTNAVINFVLGQLPKAVIETVEKAIVLGVAGIDSIHSIAGEVSATPKPEDWVTKKTDYQHVSDALAGVAENIEVDNNIVVVMSKANYTKLKWQTVSGNGTNQQLVVPFEATKQDIADVYGFARIVTPSWMKGKDEIYGFSAGEYYMVGNSTTESFQDFDLPFNRERFLLEIFTGGSIGGLNRAYIAGTSTATK